MNQRRIMLGTLLKEIEELVTFFYAHLLRAFVSLPSLFLMRWEGKK